MACGHKKAFVIISELNGMVLDVERGNKAAGTRVITYPRHGKINQQWYLDCDKHTIRSMLNDYCLDIEGGQLVVNPFKPGDQNQNWEQNGKLICNCNDKKVVLDIDAENIQQGAKVIKYQVHKKPNQCWKFELL